MKILLHACCGPCSLMPYQELSQNHEVFLYFYNPNIHPEEEFEKRKATFENYAKSTKSPYFIYHQYQDENNFAQLLPTLTFKERCLTCYKIRLEKAAEMATLQNCQAFTTSLLYSKYQLHSHIIEEAEKAAEKFHTQFYYQDYRTFWYKGIQSSKEQNMYRQKYCGCYLSKEKK